MNTLEVVDTKLLDLPRYQKLFEEWSQSWSMFYLNEKKDYVMDVFFKTTEPQVLVQILRQSGGGFHKLPGKNKIQELSKHGGIIWAAPDQVVEIGRALMVTRGGWWCCFVDGWTRECSKPWGERDGAETSWTVEDNLDSNNRKRKFMEKMKAETALVKSKAEAIDKMIDEEMRS